LLIPVGLNLPSGPELNSLKKLADARGSFAHTMALDAKYGEYKKANKVLTPEEAQSIATDCLNMCKDILQRTNAIW
jgi:hypothetical protein